jgi:hypothetical protein
VAIPDKAEKEESGATGQKHTFISIMVDREQRFLISFQQQSRGVAEEESRATIAATCP